MKIAYLISAYTEPAQLGNLINALDMGDADFYIHIDEKVNIIPFKKICEGKENIYFVEKRERVCWGGFTQVHAIMKMIENALNSGKEYDRLVSMTGTDYPVMSNSEIIDYFEKNSSKEIICAWDISGQKNTYAIYANDFGNISNIVVKIIKKVYYVLLHSMRVRKRKGPKIGNESINVFCGSDYWAVSLECAKYIYKIYRSEKAYNRWMKSVMIPSEKYVQTVLCNSIFAHKCLVFSKEIEPTFQQLTPLHYVEYGKSIKILNESDYDKIVKSGKMFARKVYSQESKGLIELLDLRRGKL